MGLFDKFFGKKAEEVDQNQFPAVPEGMKGVLLKQVGMH
jgi:hypothetical protein